MTKEEKAAKAQTDALIDQLLAKSGISREAVLGEGGLIAQLTKRVVEVLPECLSPASPHL